MHKQEDKMIRSMHSKFNSYGTYCTLSYKISSFMLSFYD